MCVARRGWLGSRVVINDGEDPRELSELVVPLSGSLESTGDPFLQYRLLNGDGVAVQPVTAFFAELAACGRPPRPSALMGWICCAGSDPLTAPSPTGDQMTLIAIKELVWSRMCVVPCWRGIARFGRRVRGHWARRGSSVRRGGR